MKDKSKYLILVILFLVMCGGVVTFALFRTNKSGSATVNAAKWDVKFKNGETEIEDNFSINLENVRWTNELGGVASGKIAPGSTATFYLTIDATGTETSVDYTIEIGDTSELSAFEVEVGNSQGTIAYSTAENAMKQQIPITITWNGDIDDGADKIASDLALKNQTKSIPLILTAAQKINFSQIDASAVTYSGTKTLEAALNELYDLLS